MFRLLILSFVKFDESNHEGKRLPKTLEVCRANVTFFVSLQIIIYTYTCLLELNAIIIIDEEQCEQKNVDSIENICVDRTGTFVGTLSESVFIVVYYGTKNHGGSVRTNPRKTNT